jgi:hypothetical protein
MKTTKRAPLSFNTDKVIPPAAIVSEKTSLQENTQTQKQPTKQTRKRESEQTKASRAGRQFIAAHVMPEAAKQFKMLALQKDTTTQDLLIEAINDLFAKHKLSRIA